ncbi:MAG: hypothetical protein ACFB5Z_13645 [Elainellaceae cyanobacterium]
MTTKPPFIPLISLVLLIAAGGGTLFALSTSNRQSDTLRETPAVTEPKAAEPTLTEPAPPELPLRRDTPPVNPTPSEAPTAQNPRTQAPQTQAPQTKPNRTQPAPAGYDTTIVPGERVGPITRNTSRQDLVDLFGEQQLVDMEVHVGEGFTEPGVEIALDDGHTLSLIWTDDTQSGVREVRTLGPAWQTPEGIHVGMPLEGFKQVAGDFEFYGFGWDYGGTVVLDSTRVAQYADNLTVRMAVDGSQPTQALLGDTQYSSINSGLEALDPYIDEMIVTLTP